MKSFIKNLFFIIVLMVSIPSFAISSIDVDKAGFGKLSATEQSKIIAEVEEKANLANGTTLPTVDKVSKWVQVGTDLGKGLASAAKELGIAANEFVKTPVGMMVAGLIIWHFMGGMVVHVVGGILVWVVGYTFTTVVLRRQQRFTIDYDKEGKKTRKLREELPDGNATAYWLAYAAVTLLGITVMFSF